MGEPRTELWAYLAGLIDADGSFAVYRRQNQNKYDCYCKLANADLDLLEWVVETFKAGKVGVEGRRAAARHRTAWFWRLNGRKSVPLVEKILPHLRVKKQRAKLYLRFAKTLGCGRTCPARVHAERRYIAEEMARLNYQGVPVK